MIKNWLQQTHYQSFAVTYGNQKWFSQSALESHEKQLVRLLQQQGAIENERIAMIGGSSWFNMLALRVCAKLGLVFFPVTDKLPEQSQQTLLVKAGIHLLINQGGELQVKRISTLPAKLKDIALFIATSGSSGEPKAVMLSHQALTTSAEMSNKLLQLASSDCWLNALPLHHIGGISILIRTALAGAKMILHEGFDANGVWKDIVTRQVTHISLVPTMLKKLLDAADSAPSDSHPPSTLRVVLIGGAALNAQLANRAIAAGWPLHPTYGMSEMASQVATGQPGNEYQPSIPLLPGVQARVLTDGQLLSRGTGQLYLKAKTRMIGYANEQGKPGLGLDDNNWLISGDIAALDAHRNIRIIGRADDVLISGGENVHPAVIENTLLNCPGVTCVCVIGQDDTSWGQKLCAVYCGNQCHTQLEQWARTKLSGVYLPRKYLQVNQLPELDNGKINRYRVKQKYSLSDKSGHDEGATKIK